MISKVLYTIVSLVVLFLRPNLLLIFFSLLLLFFYHSSQSVLSSHSSYFVQFHENDGALEEASEIAALQILTCESTPDYCFSMPY